MRLFVSVSSVVRRQEIRLIDGDLCLNNSDLERYRFITKANNKVSITLMTTVTLLITATIIVPLKDNSTNNKILMTIIIITSFYSLRFQLS